MPHRKQYLFVDIKKHRRHSAPEYLCNKFYKSQSLQGETENQNSSSISDFSVVFETQSDSGSSLELDTSTISRDLSPTHTAKSSPRNSTAIDFDFLKERGVHNLLWTLFTFWPIWKRIILGQLIAGCITLMDFSNEAIRHSPKNFITNGQNFPHYFVLGVLWTSKLALRKDGRDMIEIFRSSGLRYLFLSLLHVEANYLLVSSFHYNSYLGNEMMNFTAASLSLAIAYVFIEVQFESIHTWGCALSILGALSFCVIGATHQNRQGVDLLFGDVLRITSGLCLALNSCAQELITKSIDVEEYMGMIGLIGSFICGIQTMILDTNKIIPKNSSYWLSLLLYTFTQLLLNFLTPKVLRDVGATGLHLAWISSGFYSYFLGVMIKQKQVHVTYALLHFASVIGSTLFAIKKTTVNPQHFFPIKVTLTKNG